MLNKIVKNKGFTLIEMMVVIAVFDLFSSVIFIVLRGGHKAKDARIVADLYQVRSVAEINYDGDFDWIPAKALGEACPNTNADLQKLCNDIFAQGGDLVIARPSSPVLNYCAYSILNLRVEGLTNYYCIDSTGTAGYTAINPGNIGAQNRCTASGGYICPPDTM